MSEENVDRMREAIAAMNRGDVEGAVRGFDPEVQFEHRLASLQGSFVGVHAVRGWFTDLFNHFETSHIDCPDIRDLGDQVLALGTVYAAGTESGVQTELPFTVVARFRDGLCTHFVDYADKREALKAVGLLE